MEKLDPNALKVGEELPGSLCDHTGRVLFHAGHALQSGDLKVLERFSRRGVFGGEDWPSEPEKSSAAEAEPAYRSGQTLEESVYSDDGMLLLAAGEQVTDEQVPHLRERAKQSYSALDFESDCESELSVASIDLNSAHPLPPAAERRIPLSDLRAETEHGEEMYAESLDKVENIATDIARGKVSGVTAARSVVSRFMHLVETDASLLPAVVRLRESEGDYLFQHGMNVALLSMAAAGQLGVGANNIIEIGVGALLQDVGMLRVPQDLRMAPRCLNPEEQQEINRHPTYTLDFLRRMEGLSEVSALIAYQSHERMNGSGYPNNRHQMFIHPFARLVATVDTYAAITAHRPHRYARSPYEAMEVLLRQASQNLFDRDMVRTFLDCMSLFPVGSYVRLSDGSVARIVRPNPGLHTRPCVVLLRADGSESDTEIDLSLQNGLRVVQALRGKNEAILRFKAVA